MQMNKIICITFNNYYILFCTLQEKNYMKMQNLTFEEKEVLKEKVEKRYKPLLIKASILFQMIYHLLKQIQIKSLMTLKLMSLLH